VNPPSEMMTANEVAAFLKVNRATVYRLVKRKRLPSFRVGRDHRFRRAEIDEWIEAREKAREKP
jgi:excisionase family DNA binding protein